MADQEKNTNHHKWYGNSQDDNQAQPDGVVPVVIQHKNKWAKGQTDHHKDDATDKLPFPGKDQKCQ